MKTTSEFPYTSFPIRLEFKEGKNTKCCFFQDKIHLNAYLIRNKLKKKDVTIKQNKK